MGTDKFTTDRFFFVHVMKTGGTSLVLRLLRQFEPREVYPDAELDRRHVMDAEPYASLADLVALSDERRAAIVFYAGHFPFMARDLIGDGVKTITLLRDPIDRTTSVLKHFKRLHARFRDLPLDAIYDDPFVFRYFVENYQTKVFALAAADHPIAFAGPLPFDEVRAALETAPASVVQHSVSTADLARAKTNLEHVDVVGASEHFGDFVEALRSRFGWLRADVHDELRANASSEPWVATAALRARIARDNAIDAELYEYAQEIIRHRQS